jgi:uncharacterized RDD family membrane protein YckC
MFDMKARFEPDPAGLPAYQAGPFAVGHTNPSSENKVSAEADQTPLPSDARFVVDVVRQESQPPRPEFPIARQEFVSSRNTADAVASPVKSLDASSSVVETPVAAAPVDDAWRQEVAARLDHYRRRKRPRVPRYPSLQLKFEDVSWNKPAKLVEPPVSRLAVAMQEIVPGPAPEPVEEPETGESIIPQPAGKILEFPRFFATPQLTFNELADPVLDRPRILDVPEQLPPPPALGGISIEAQEQASVERRPGFELPLNPPLASRRLAAGAMDAALVLTAFAVFAYMFFRIAAILPITKASALVSAALIACLWVGYQYLFLVHSGATPGLRLAHLRLSRFDGQPVPSRLRRWRVLASALSGFSLGLGYAWCMLDEDQLCWHDRITHTYMAIGPGRQSGSPVVPESPPAL